jgi:probable HAF family extracellular repeat protein
MTMRPIARLFGKRRMKRIGGSAISDQFPRLREGCSARPGAGANAPKWLTLAFVALALTTPLAVQAGTYLKVVPVAGSSATIATGINDSNVIAGYFTDANGQHIFMGTLDGTYTTCDLKGISTPSPTSINNVGVVIGNSEIGSFYTGNSCGYFLIGKGRKLNPLYQERANQVANSDRVIGYYTDRKSGQIRGFYAQGAQYKSDFSLGFQNSGDVKPSGINAQGSVVGYAYIDAYEEDRAFLYQNGTTSFIDYGPNIATYPRSINDNGIVAGEFVTAGHGGHNRYHAYLYNTQTQIFKELKVKNAENVYVSGTLNSAGYVPLQTDKASLIYCPYSKSRCAQN